MEHITLPVNYYVVGIITDDGTPVSNANVHIQGDTVISGTTNSSGKYTLNIKNYATNGATITVRGFGNGKYKTDTFILNIGNPAQLVNLALDAVTISDTITIGESVTQTANMQRNLNDTVTLGDNVTQMANMQRSLSDIVTLGDTVSQIATLQRNLSDTVTIGESVSQIANMQRTMNDAITLSDSFFKNVSFILNDTVTLNDNVIQIADMQRSLNDTINIGESLNQIAGFYRSFIDAVTLNDSVSQIGVFIRSLNDTITIIETLTSVFTSGEFPSGEVDDKVRIYPLNENFYKITNKPENFYIITKKEEV